ncbi:MAG: CoB--CoM heterodisulfide reductase iron-sulfur subunit B family protein [Candidatus Bathyarchaeota archaeon]|nr:CoB--CoM heterodisulfide reductase iron-sulfur subunit B family protein [Candidatus Bathyarchaeota archaeon]MDH5595242.1 CoB--CoM heterodisulfide reductase iron-sulfur subunit B family protein [Candidatus Bathyarchaeota archaeon]
MTELKYLLFLGCVIPYRLPSFEISTRRVLDKLGVELVEMPEFNCCGFPLDPVNHDMMLTLAARNLCLAEQQNLNIITLCNGCFGILNHVNKELKEDKKIKEKVNGYLKEIGMEFKGTITVKHLIHVLAEDVGFEKIKETVQKPLNQLRVAQHSGCHVVRPAKYIGFEDPENPTTLKKLIQVTGAKCLDYMDEPECCGAPIVGVNDKIPLQLAREKLDHIKAVGAQAMITCCPYCHIMYDLNQPRIERAFNEKFGIPVLHYPQLLGLAMGIAPEELALKDLRVDATKILNICS